MTITRRSLVMAGLTVPFVAHAQTAWKPSQAIRLVVPFAPGTAMDPVARFVQDHFQKTLGVPLIIDNRPGAATLIGGMDVLRSPPDGHTLFMMANSFAANVTLRAEKTSTWPNAFQPVVMATIVPHVLTLAPGIAADFKGFVDYCKRPGNAAIYGSPGIGTSLHLGAEQFCQLSGIKATHVAYNGTAQLIQDIMSERVHFMFGNLPDVVQPAKEKHLVPVAVAAPRRVRDLPDVPTLGELGFPQVLSDSWFGVVVRAEVPEIARQTLERVWIEALTQAGIRQKLEGLGYEVLALPGAEFGATIQKYVRVYAEVIKTANIRVE